MSPSEESTLSWSLISLCSINLFLANWFACIAEWSPDWSEGSPHIDMVTHFHGCFWSLEAGNSQNILGKGMLMLGAISIQLAKRNPPGSAWEPCGTTLQRAWGGLIQWHTIIAQCYYPIAPLIKISGSLKCSNSCSQQRLLEIHLCSQFSLFCAAFYISV